MESYYIVELRRECINKYARGYNMILRKREGSKFRWRGRIDLGNSYVDHERGDKAKHFYVLML